MLQANLVHLYEAAYFDPRSSHVIQLLEKYRYLLLHKIISKVI